MDHQLSRFLVDAGSALTIIPRKLAKIVEPSSLRLTAANGSNIKTYGSSVLNLSLYKLRRDFPWRCIVADVTTPIIGADFLAHYGILIDFKNCRIQDSTTKIFAHGQICHDKYNTLPIRAVETDLLHHSIKILKKSPLITLPSSYHDTSPKTQHYSETLGQSIFTKCRTFYGRNFQSTKQHSAGQAKNVSLHLLKPVIEKQEADCANKRRIKEFSDQTTLFYQANNHTYTLPSFPDNTQLTSHYEFNRHIKFAETNQIRFIAKYGKSRPVSRR